MLMFLYNIGMTIRKSGRFTTTEGVLLLGLGSAAVLYLPALLALRELHRLDLLPLVDDPPVGRRRVGDDPGRLPRLSPDPLSGADREVMEKWLYVIVGLVFIAGILGTAHHYYWVGVPSYWLPIGGIFSALEPVALVGMADVRLFRDAPIGHGASRIRWRCTGRSAAPSSRCSAPGCWASPIPGPASTSGRTAR